MNYLPESMFQIETIYNYYFWRELFDNHFEINVLFNEIEYALKNNWYKEIISMF